MKSVKKMRRQSSFVVSQENFSDENDVNDDKQEKLENSELGGENAPGRRRTLSEEVFYIIFQK